MPELPRKSTAKQFKKLMKASGKSRNDKSSGASNPSTRKISTYEQFCTMNEGIISFFNSITVRDIVNKMSNSDKYEKSIIDDILKYKREHPNQDFNDFADDTYIEHVNLINKKLLTFLKEKDETLQMFVKIVKKKKLTQEELDLVVKLWGIFEKRTPLFIYVPFKKLSQELLDKFIANANKFLNILNQLKDKFNIDILTDDEYLIQNNNSFLVPVRKSILYKNRYFTPTDPYGEEDWGT